MDKLLIEKEYSSLRDEIMKWQDRRIVFSQIALTLVIAYTGYLVSKDIKEVSALSWQVVSILPLLILSITIHITKLFELFQVRAAAFLVIFYDTNWEKNVGEKGVSLSTGTWTLGYNKSMAIVYLIVALGTIFIFTQKYPTSFSLLETIVFSIVAIAFLVVVLRLFMFKSTEKKKEFLEGWRQIKNNQ